MGIDLLEEAFWQAKSNCKARHDHLCDLVAFLHEAHHVSPACISKSCLTAGSMYSGSCAAQVFIANSDTDRKRTGKNRLQCPTAVCVGEVK